VLARKHVPSYFAAWNRKWKAPFGPGWSRRLSLEQRLNPIIARLLGPFAYQPNNTTRTIEYPWAYHAVPLRRGTIAVEVGGAIAGFQFALARAGAIVTNVDPFVDYGSDARYSQPLPVLHARLNRIFGTNVALRNCVLSDADIPSNSADIVYSISTLEHLTHDDLEQTMLEIRRILRPGGMFVATIDLFLNVAPFNRWGTNISVHNLVTSTGMALVLGTASELCGYPEFDPERIQTTLDEYFIGDYPALTQMIVLQKR
jgi:SAM-dependent methyltransferase